jgi:hypothetical protein
MAATLIRARAQQQAAIDAIVADVVRSMPREVVRIRYSFDSDWSGDPGLFFRVVLADAATKGKRLSKTTSAVRQTLREKLLPLELEEIPYFNFRSRSETLETQDQAWD